MRKLSVVATPIGNLEDITLRALRTLKEADTIACEDTRVTRKLLSHFNITTPTISFHAHSGEEGMRTILRMLEEGKHVALVCDAGTPGVSDPGLELLSRVREKFASTTPIEAIPGSSALTSALSVSGLRAASFTFYGFLPLKKGREKLLRDIAESPRASIVYESPHRIVKMLESLEKLLPPERRIGVFRELTKIHEEHLIGSTEEVRQKFLQNPQRQKGEIVVIVEGK